MNSSVPEPYSAEAQAAANRASEVFFDLRDGAKDGGVLGGGVATTNGGQYVNEIGFAVRGKSGETYHVCLTPREMERLGFVPAQAQQPFDADRIGQQGWIAYLSTYPLHVEFLGFDSHQPDCGEPERYFRALEDLRTRYEDISAGDIVREDGPLYEIRAGAVHEANIEREKEVARARQRLEEAERPIS